MKATVIAANVHITVVSAKEATKKPITYTIRYGKTPLGPNK